MVTLIEPLFDFFACRVLIMGLDLTASPKFQDGSANEYSDELEVSFVGELVKDIIAL